MPRVDWRPDWCNTVSDHKLTIRRGSLISSGSFCFLKKLNGFFDIQPLRFCAWAVVLKPINTTRLRIAKLKNGCFFAIGLSGYGLACPLGFGGALYMIGWGTCLGGREEIT